MIEAAEEKRCSFVEYVERKIGLKAKRPKGVEGSLMFCPVIFNREQIVEIVSTYYRGQGYMVTEDESVGNDSGEMLSFSVTGLGKKAISVTVARDGDSIFVMCD